MISSVIEQFLAGAEACIRLYLSCRRAVGRRGK